MAKPNGDGLSPRCEKVKRSGERCGANAQAGSRWCFFHDPAKTAERTAARRAGGSATRATVLPLDTPSVTLASVSDVVTLLAETINHVRRGALDVRVANCVGYLAGHVLTALEKGELEQRMTELERRLLAQQPQLVG